MIGNDRCLGGVCALAYFGQSDLSFYLWSLGFIATCIFVWWAFDLDWPGL